jgi:tellurite resistance protein TehA-like permease
MVSPRLTTGVLGRTLDSIPPAAGAEVMATGIVSIALSLDGHETLSRVILAIAAAIWVTLAVLLPLRAMRDPARFRADARTPAALTAVVATCVLGTGLTSLGWTWAGVAALVIALLLSAAVVGPVLAGWKSPTVGVSLLLAVCPEALAVLAATLAVAEDAGWLLIAALVPFALGLGLYVFVISRFDVHQLAVGRGDHWITGGALGISALAAAKISAGAGVLGIAGVRGGALEDIAIGLCVLTMLWLLVLLFAEARWPRLSLGPARWSTVFPLGMYAASSFAVGAAAHASAITSFARVWVWIGLAAWAIVLAATIGRAVKVLR